MVKIGRRALTDTKSSRQMTFDKDCLDEFGFKAGTYNVVYDKDIVIITKEVTKNIIEFLENKV